ncbi:S66 peptidase family protein [Croceicoccus gelatinilyticus]|uniref:S66 peptidase family protein n=1 Tax=Croceicoccus gelatinilyticus TaxID=2835536 RepID=UPI001BCEDEAE|nr:LD-carboxypeptidase [Croceicoccus gelatinilyticus]MBS7670397.1 LD-carboxypeptidase [Croceicoccus gelatinilyticus]
MTTRRAALAGLGAATGLALSPAPVAARKPVRKPPRLREGDVVGLVEPAGYTSGPDALARVRHTVEGMGLVPRIGDHVGERFGYLAGTDEQRASDINAMFADDEIRAVFAVRGGWGSARILSLLDWDLIRRNPKLLVGFSDVTGLHMAFAAKAGYPTISAPNMASSWLRQSWESFWWLAFAGSAPILGGARADLPIPFETITGGKARGKMLGGNLTVLTALVGTPWLPVFDGAILFLEDIGEAEYRIDRMLSQLSLSGMLGKLSGVVFGQCTRCATDEPDYAGFTVPDVVRQWVEPLGIPAFLGANIGHIRDQLSIPLGVEVEIDADAGTIAILEAVVT